jgi:hypothetical protein
VPFALRAIRTASRLSAVAAVLVWPLTTAAASLSPEEAPGHVGENATVCGIVASAHYAARSKSQPTFLNLGKAYPAQVFTAVIFGSDRAKFGEPEKALQAKRICVTGTHPALSKQAGDYTDPTGPVERMIDGRSGAEGCPP